MKHFLLSIFFLLVAASLGAQDLSTARTGPERVLHALFTAFNAHDTDAMAALVAPDVRWFIMTSDTMEIQASGRDAFRESMAGYFTSTPTVRSEIEEMMVTGEYLAVRERVYWISKSGERSAASLGVYEIRDGLIVRAWYYPAVK